MDKEYHIKVGGTETIVPAGYKNRAYRRWAKRKGIKYVK
jgi:protein subunit release factor B